jgi:hypothetical protein
MRFAIVRRSRSAAAFAVLAAVMIAAPLTQVHAQSQATTGVMRGVVTDTSGAPVVRASVTLRGTETNYERVVTSSDRGVFVATLLPLGPYDVTVRALGFRPESRRGLIVRLGQTVDVPVTLQRTAQTLAEVTVTAAAPLVDVRSSESATQLSDAVVAALPNNGRNFLNLTLLTPNVAIVQGPDGDELSIGGQRGIHNNVSVDGADFNNPFFGEQRGGQRPAFTFNLDAVQELVVVAQGANAEFGRSSGGFVNVITKSGTNQTKGSVHYFGKYSPLAWDARYKSTRLEPDFSQNQFGFTLGGPLVRDRLFYFVAYDQQLYRETKQKTRPQSAAFDSLQTFLQTAFGGVLAGDFGPIDRTNDANALLMKLDWNASAAHRFSLKYNYTNSRQENGTFDFDTWSRSANAVERDYSNALNGFLASQLGETVANEFRFQLAREDRPRPYDAPTLPGGRDFPDTGMDFAYGFRLGRPFFIPVKDHDTRVQLLDNLSWVTGDHLFKVGGEWNRTETNQTFVGFANGRFIFTSVTGFINYVQQGNGYVECSNGTRNNTGACPGGTTITGPIDTYLQQVGVDGRSVEDAGTQSIVQHDLALYVQDSWKARPNLTLNYGLRWEAQVEPDPITPPDEVFFSDFIGQTVNNATGTYTFPSDGTIPSDWKMFQPRLGIAWDVQNDGRRVLRASTGLYYARIPGLNLASARSTNGSIGQTLFRNSALTGILGRPPAYDALLPAPAGAPFQPNVFVFDKDFQNPRTWSSTAAFETEITDRTAAFISYTYAKTDHLTRFVDRNAAVFGNPWTTGPNALGSLTTVESSAKSRYNGVTVGLERTLDPRFQYQVNYTLSTDKSDDDNERDPFSFRYARADSLDAEYGYSDRDQRHRFNAWTLVRIPWSVYLNNRISAYSAQPTSAKCIANRPSDERATQAGDRICADGHIIERNTLRKANSYFSWDLRLSRPFAVARGGTLEAMVEVFNVTNAKNFRDPAATSPLFNFDGTIRSGLGDPRQVQVGMRYIF